MEKLIIPRRQFLKGISALIVAPAIVKIESIMPVNNLNTPIIIKNQNSLLIIQIIMDEAIELFKNCNKFNDILVVDKVENFGRIGR